MSASPSVRVSFLQCLLEDKLAAGVRPLEEYQRRFPGYEQEIAEAYGEACGAAGRDGGGALAGRSPADCPSSTASSLRDLVEKNPGDPHRVADELAEQQQHQRCGAAFELDSEKPSRLGPYRVIRELGRGGQGVVYLAHDERLDRRVALKVMARRWSDSPEAWNRLRREALLAARLDHRGICTVFEAATRDGIGWLAMQYVEGESLALRMARAHRSGGPGTRAEILESCRLIEGVARAVHAAHQAGIVHRDLKPSNVMVTPEGNGVVLDFGLAREMEGGEASLTRTGDLFGTPAYMAPEQVRGDGAGIGPPTDVHALGVILYEMVTGRRPFDGATREALFHAILSVEPTRVRRLQPAAPRDLEVVLQAALAKEPSRRYHDAGALADDLRAAREARPVAVSRPGPAARLARWARRDPLRASLSAGLSLVLLVAAGLGGYLLAQRQEIREGQRAIEDRQRRRLLMQALGAYEQTGSLVVSRVKDVLRTHPDLILPRIALAMVALENDDLPGAERILAECLETQAAMPCLRLIEEEIERRRSGGSRPIASGTPEAGAESPTPPATETPLDELTELVSGWILLDRSRRTHDPTQVQAARRHLDRALLVAPRPRWVTAEIRARCLMEASDDAALEDAARAMVSRWPESASAWGWLGMARRLEAKEIEGSRQALAEAVRRDPDNPKYLMWSCLAEIEGGALEEAAALFDRVVTSLRRSHPELIAYQRYLYGNSLFSMGYAEEAIAPLEEVLDEHPEDGVARLALGRAYLMLELPDEAADEMWDLLDREPRNEAASRLLCQVLQDQGETAALEEELERRCRLAPDDVVAWAQRALLLDREGDPEGSAVALGQTLRAIEHLRAVQPDLATAIESLTHRARTEDDG